VRTIAQATLKRIKRRDRLARWVVVLGGMTIIASVIAILVLIVGVTLPLFRPARATELARVPLPPAISTDDVLCVGTELGMGEHSFSAHVLTRDGTFTLLDLSTAELLGRQPIAPPARGTDRVMAVERHAGSRYSLLWADGSVSLVEVKATADFDTQGHRRVEHSAVVLASFPTEGGPAPVRAQARKSESGSLTCVRLLADGRIRAARQITTENLLGEVQTKSQPLEVDLSGLGPITALAMDREGTTLYAGTARGEIARWGFDAQGRAKSREVVVALAHGRAVTALAMVFGDVSLAVGDSSGGLSTWFPVRIAGVPRLSPVHDLASHEGAVREILPSMRHKSLLSVGEDGTLHLDHATSERHLLSISSPAPLKSFGLAPRGNAAIALDAEGQLCAWQIDAPHPEVSWKTLFGKVHYEGYESPAYAWQTTGGDDFEAKLSLVPLVSGTLKGTFYAMLFAVPLALFGAVYTSHFTTPGFKRAVKPVVEIMAAVPSVVLGFLAALWLAPLIERWVLAVLASFLTVPAVFVGFMVVWQLVRQWDWAKRVESGYEFLVLVPVLAAGVWLALALVPAIESLLFDGDFRSWLYQTAGMRYDQRNCVIIAFGLGFAVIPIILSIAEDSLSSVPYTLTAASMALGASRWQTLWRVVLPSASPGIFAGVMIGFGRAVGETMIVLMATGNTPILDWSPLSGMRTLSANIAVEIPEAPVGGTLYRLLFLCAVLLFLMTFALNTAAELVRQRLRKRCGRF